MKGKFPIWLFITVKLTLSRVQRHLKSKHFTISSCNGIAPIACWRCILYSQDTSPYLYKISYFELSTFSDSITRKIKFTWEKKNNCENTAHSASLKITWQIMPVPQTQVKTSARRQSSTTHSFHSTAQKLTSYKLSPHGEQQLTDIHSLSEGSNVYLEHRPRNINSVWCGKSASNLRGCINSYLYI